MILTCALSPEDEPAVAALQAHFGIPHRADWETISLHDTQTLSLILLGLSTRKAFAGMSHRELSEALVARGMTAHTCHRLTLISLRRPSSATLPFVAGLPEALTATMGTAPEVFGTRGPVLMRNSTAFITERIPINSGSELTLAEGIAPTHFWRF